VTPEEPPTPALVFIFGPAAVGKMTVGQELKELTGYRLLYNHLVVDLVTQFFTFDTPPFHALAREFTRRIIEVCAQERVGLIITHGLLFDGPRAQALIDHWSAPYRNAGIPIWYAELQAPLDVRLARNETPNRRRHKNVDWSTPERLREMEGWGRWGFGDDWPHPARRLSLDTTDLPAATAAAMIQQRFALPSV
jgi:hypothetical protein